MAIAREVARAYIYTALTCTSHQKVGVESHRGAVPLTELEGKGRAGAQKATKVAETQRSQNHSHGTTAPSRQSFPALYPDTQSLLLCFIHSTQHRSRHQSVDWLAAACTSSAGLAFSIGFTEGARTSTSEVEVRIQFEIQKKGKSTTRMKHLVCTNNCRHSRI
jgi:hypothetical protein